MSKNTQSIFKIRNIIKTISRIEKAIFVSMVSLITRILIKIAKKIITVYIDDTSLKLVIIQRNVITKSDVLKLKQGSIADGVILDKKEVSSKINELLTKNRIKSKKLAVGMSGLHNLSRVISIPRVSKKLLNEGVIWEAKRVLPVAVEDYYISWQILPPPGPELNIFLVALLRVAVDSLVSTLKGSGLKLHFLEIAPLSLSRLAPILTAIIVNIRPIEADIVLIADGVPCVTRNLSFTDRTVSLQERLPLIKEELKRTIKYYNSEHLNAPLDINTPIYFPGERIKESLRYLVDEDFKYPVFALPLPVKNFQAKAIDVVDFTLNIGLSLVASKNLSKTKVNFNVLPLAFHHEPVSKKLVFSIFSAILAVLLLGWVSMFVTDVVFDTNALQTRVEAEKMKLQLLVQKQKSQKGEVTRLENEVTASTLLRDSLNGIKDDLYKYNENILQDLKWIILVPSDVRLLAVGETGNKWTLEVRSPSETELLQYIEHLERRERFTQVLITSMKEEPNQVNSVLSVSTD